MSGQTGNTTIVHNNVAPTVLLKNFLVLLCIAVASLFLIHTKVYAYSSPDPDSGVNFSPRALGIPQFGNAVYTVTYTNNSSSAISDIVFAPGSTSGVGSQFVQVVSISGCDSVSITSQGDQGTCYTSIPVGGSKTITVNFSNGGWTVSSNNTSFNYIPVSVDEVNGTSIGVAPNVAVSTGVSYSPAMISIPRYGNTNYTVTYTNNSSSAISDVVFAPGGTTGVGSQFVQVVSMSGCDSVNISSQGDVGTCYTSIPVGSSKTITVNFSNGGWTDGDGSGSQGANYIPAGVDEVNGTSIGVSPYIFMSTPIVNQFSGATINAGDTYTANGSFTDPNTHVSSWTATVGYGDGSGLQTLTLNGTNFSLSHQYTTAGTYTVSVSVTDDQGTTGVGTATVIVNAVNAPPHVNQLNGGTINEGGTYSENGSFTDTDSTSWTATVDYGDGGGAQPLTLSGMNFSLSHQYKDEGTYTVTVAVTDNQGATGTGTATITVNNATPSVGAITVTTNPVQVNTATTATASFTDPGVLDTHTATWNWGDGNTTTGTVTESNGSGTVGSDSHTYTAAGVYTITLTVTDDDGTSPGTQTFQYVSVYNPTSQGLFSAGSHFTSPVGAYPQNPNLSGNVKFGLSYKYQGTMPVGDKQFTMNFNAANLTFNATTISSLVIANGIGTLTGTGTLNGSGTYNFLVTGSESATTIRIQITDSSNTVIYDTQPGAAATATPTTSVTGHVLAH